ncbi:MAG: fibronectin type III domain-containing protein [Saprospiraceae bacterium]|nr:fibronectin type III domain-containing protein [Saprospiraceae bacterium]
MKVNFKLMTMAFFAMAALFASCSKENIETAIPTTTDNVTTASDRSNSITLTCTGGGNVVASWAPFGNGTYHITVQDITNKQDFIIVVDEEVYHSYAVNGLTPGHTYRYKVTDGQGLNYIIRDDFILLL